MRCLLKVELGLAKANAAAADGALGATIQAILKEQKPEAAYFFASNGKRTGLLVVNLKDASQIPALAEPWFLALDAAIEIQPVMTPADLAKAGPAIAKAARRYGQ